MKVTFAKQWSYSEHGYDINRVNPGDVVDLPDGLADAARRAGVVEVRRKSRGRAPENK